MQNAVDPGRQLTIAASNRWERDAAIDAAEMSLRNAAIEARSGILVTRKSAHIYTVAVSRSVPFGLTKELDEVPVRGRGTRCINHSRQ